MKLLLYELFKVWSKRSFQAFTCVLLLLNVFLLWYLNLPSDDEPPLSAYKAVCEAVDNMSEPEKLSYITELKKTVDGVAKIEEISQLRNIGGEMGETLAMQAEAELPPQEYAAYQELYKSGAYLVYTNSLYQEKTLIDEMYEEIKAVSDYDGYLASIQQNKDALSDISVFANVDQPSFGTRNIEKSAADHAGLDGKDIRWFPSKGMEIAGGNTVTELLLLLSVLLFTGSMITEEKEKGLFHITRATKKGIAPAITAKLSALLIHCLTVSILLCVANLLFAGYAAGLGDLTAALPSVPAFFESSLPVSLWQYLLLGMLTKGLVLFAFGVVLTGILIVSPKSFLPQLAGVGIVVLGYFAYTAAPANSTLAPVKYLSLFGLLKPELLYGGYLNFNIAGYPVSRTLSALILLVVLCTAGMICNVLLFCQGKSLIIQKSYGFLRLPFYAHGSLAVHEGGKLLFMGKGAVILLVFFMLIGYGDLGKRYAPSVSEQYYREWILSLEGEATEEKHGRILAEQARYDEAFAEIERINYMVASGEIDERTGENLKSRWNSVIFFYPSFKRILQQQEHIRQEGGVFIYDTGYAYLFGRMDKSFMFDFLLLSLCMIFAFGNGLAMEYEKKSWNLLSATAKGKWAVIGRKVLICSLCSVIISVFPWIFRLISISRTYPLHGWSSAVQNIPQYFGLKLGLPLWLFFLAAVLCQMLAVWFVCGIVLLLSEWRKSYLQTVCLGLLLLAVPSALAIMGFDFAKWASLYPLYSLVSFL